MVKKYAMKVMRERCGSLAVALVSAALLLFGAAAAKGSDFSSWGPAVNLAAINTTANEGCPIVSPDGLVLYIASNRIGGNGALDIWFSRRDSRDDPWGAPQNAGEPINSAVDDFCPAPMRGHLFFFVSKRELPGISCGGADIYVTRPHPVLGWLEPQNLGCEVNSSEDELSPYFHEDQAGGAALYFSSNRTGNSDIYASAVLADGSFAPAQPVPGLNTIVEDARPNLRRDGLEIVFDSNRSHPGALGSQDIYVAVRASVDDPWGEPVPLGPDVNSAASETRATLSWDAQSLYFGSNRLVGGVSKAGDIYLSTREKVPGGSED